MQKPAAKAPNLEEEAMPTTKNSKQLKQTKALEDQLRSRLAELKSHLDLLRKEMIIEDDVDDEAMQASRTAIASLPSSQWTAKFVTFPKSSKHWNASLKTNTEFASPVKQRFPTIASRLFLGHGNALSALAEELIERSNASWASPH